MKRNEIDTTRQDICSASEQAFVQLFQLLLESGSAKEPNDDLKASYQDNEHSRI
jgi:hypothetical protein